MPRKSGRGGRRSGTPGAAYAQRTDLQGAQPVRTAPSGGYGERVAQERAQRAVPLPSPTAPAAPVGPSAMRPGPVAGALGDPLRPTARPSEAVTAGLFGTPQGPGIDPVLNALRAAYKIAPNERVAELIERLESR